MGFFAFSLDGRGAFVEAYEPHSATFEIGAALAKLHESNVLYVNRGVSVAGLRLLRAHYRAVLLLSVFHWIVKQEGEAGASHILRDLAGRADMVFFEVPCEAGEAMFKHPRFSSRESVEGYLREILPAARLTLLAQDDSWGARLLYKIEGGGA